MSEQSHAVDAAAGTLDNPKETTMTTATLEASLRQLLGGEEKKEPDPSEAQVEELPPGAGEAVTEAPAPKAEADEHEEGKFPNEWPDSARDRLGKLTAQKGELREKVGTLETEKEALEAAKAELETKLAEASSGGTVPTPGDPLGFITTPKQLTEYVGALKANQRDIEDQLDGMLPENRLETFTKWAAANGAYDAESKEFNTDRLKALKRLAQDALSDYVPNRMNYLRAEGEQSAQAEERFPWLKDAKSPEFQEFQKVLKVLPEVKRLPHWKGTLAIFVRGLQIVNAEAAKAKGNGAGAAPRAAAPRLPGAATSVPQRPRSEENEGISALRAKAFKTGNTKDFEALIAAQLRAA